MAHMRVNTKISVGWGGAHYYQEGIKAVALHAYLQSCSFLMYPAIGYLGIGARVLEVQAGGGCI